MVRTPSWLRGLYPGCMWDVQEAAAEVYPTFDDGPDPVATPFVLDQLGLQGMRGTFFCIGKNVEAYPALYDRILREGHRTGNHTHQHLNGWKTNDAAYIADIARASACIDSELFRPPYGRIRHSQLRRLRAEPLMMRPVMWSILSGDFDPRLTPERCVNQVMTHVRPGAIITFHDSKKAFPVLRKALPEILESIRQKGWEGRSVS